MNATRGEHRVLIPATYGGYPCRMRTLGPASASLEQTLRLPRGHRAHLSFHAAGEWFHLLAEVESSTLDPEPTLDAVRPVYRTVAQLRNVPEGAAVHLAQLLHLLAIDDRGGSVLTEALQFEIVGA